MNLLCPSPRENPVFYVALVTCVILFMLSGDPLKNSPAERAELAKNYRFTRLDLPRVPNGVEPHFVREVAPSLKRIQQWCGALTSGVTFADLDGDGLPNEILYVDNRTEQMMIAPVPGTGSRFAPFQLFELGYDRKTGVPATSMVGDFNEDGRADVLAFFGGRMPALFLRKASSAKSGLSLADFEFQELYRHPNEAWASGSGVQTDLDGDGHMDLVIGNYFPDWCNIYDPKEKRIQEMHNNNGWASNGGGIHFFLWKKPCEKDPYYFREVKGLLPERVLRGWTLAIGAQDLDGDMLPELYVGNDLGPDRLLRNRSTPGNLKFEVLEGEKNLTTPGSFVMGNDKYKGMCVEFFDLNADGVGDIFVSNVAADYALHESHFMWMSRPDKKVADGQSPYRQDSEKWGVSRGGWGWCAKFESFANQVTPDLFQARGFLKGKINRWPEMQSLATYNSAFLKDPRNWPTFYRDVDISGHDLNAFYSMGKDGRFLNIGEEIGLTESVNTRGVATADVDGDGLMDIATGGSWGPTHLYVNKSPNPGNFLGVRLVIPQTTGGEPPLKVLPGRPGIPGRPAFGAVATVTLPCGRVLKREVDGGNGHAGRRAPELHFGLGKLPADTKSLQVKLRWRRPDGSLAKTVELGLERDRWHTVVLGSAPGQEVPR